LNAELEEELYVSQPLGFEVKRKRKLCIQVEKITIWPETGI